MAKKILVIEDDKDIRDTMVYVLEEEKYEVISSDNARILKKLNEINPDLILLDNWLTDWKSDASGQEISRGLKSDPLTSGIPVIIVSAVNNIEQITKDGNADDFLKKPFDLTALIAIVKKYTEL